MPFSSVATYACRALQAKYVDYFQKNAAQFKTMGSVALIKYLMSPQNMRGFKQIDVESVPGKKRPFAFMVDTPFCFNLGNPSVLCTTTRQVLAQPAQEIVYDLTGNPFRVVDGSNNPMVIQFAEADLMKYCTESNTEYIDAQIFRFLMRFEEALDKALATLLSSQVGTNADGDALTELPFFVTNTATQTKAINSDAYWWLDQNYSDIGGEGQYALVGGKVLNKINRTLKWTGLNQAGIDLSAVDDENPYSYYDRNFDTVFGQNQFLQLSPGAVQLVYWNQYKGERKRSVTDLYSKDTIISPLTGLPIDWKWTYDYNCEVWTFEPFLYAELAVNRPGGCGLATSNGIIKYSDCSDSLTPPVCPDEE